MRLGVMLAGLCSSDALDSASAPVSHACACWHVGSALAQKRGVHCQLMCRAIEIDHDAEVEAAMLAYRA